MSLRTKSQWQSLWFAPKVLRVYIYYGAPPRCTIVRLLNASCVLLPWCTSRLFCGICLPLYVSKVFCVCMHPKCFVHTFTMVCLASMFQLLIFCMYVYKDAPLKSVHLLWFASHMLSAYIYPSTSLKECVRTFTIVHLISTSWNC